MKKKLQKQSGLHCQPQKMSSGNFSEEGCVNPKHKLSANREKNDLNNRGKISGKCFD